jgi:hypothetical protein
MNSFPCTICGEAGHRAYRCPTLSSPLQPGFYKPSGGYRPSEDDEDEKAKREVKLNIHNAPVITQPRNV